MSKQELINMIDAYLDDSVEMDFMKEFATISNSDDVDVRSMAEFMCHVATCEYPNFRQSTDFKRFLLNIREMFVCDAKVDAQFLGRAVASDAAVLKLFELHDREMDIQKWSVLAMLTAVIGVVVLILIFG